MKKGKKNKKKDENSLVVFVSIGLAVIIICILLVIFLLKDDKKYGDLVSFEYHSGSVGNSVDYKGKVSGDIINIEFYEMSGAKNELKKEYQVNKKDFESLLSNSKEESCEKHTYESQCGDLDGCGYSSFKLSYMNVKMDVCYEITDEIVSFFQK